jgi:hypothetical protein
MADKPVMEMNSQEWADELARVARREFARKCIREDEDATKAYLAQRFPPEGKAGDDPPPPDEKTDAQKLVDAARYSPLDGREGNGQRGVHSCPGPICLLDGRLRGTRAQVYRRGGRYLAVRASCHRGAGEMGAPPAQAWRRQAVAPVVTAQGLATS